MHGTCHMIMSVARVHRLTAGTTLHDSTILTTPHSHSPDIIFYVWRSVAAEGEPTPVLECLLPGRAQPHAYVQADTKE